MGKVEKVTCVVCGKTVNRFDADEVFVGRIKYKCFKCSNKGNSETMHRMIEKRKRRQ